jgi:hypothetical protein
MTKLLVTTGALQACSTPFSSVTCRPVETAPFARRDAQEDTAGRTLSAPPPSRGPRRADSKPRSGASSPNSGDSNERLDVCAGPRRRSSRHGMGAENSTPGSNSGRSRPQNQPGSLAKAKTPSDF